MICYGVWSFFHAKTDEEETTGMEMKLSAKATNGIASVFLSAVGLLVLLDLAGDATEVLTILFLTRFGDTFLVFIATVIALIAATAVDTTIGNRVSRIRNLYQSFVEPTLSSNWNNGGAIGSPQFLRQYACTEPSKPRNCEVKSLS